MIKTKMLVKVGGSKGIDYDLFLEDFSNKCIRLNYTNWMLPIKKLVRINKETSTTKLETTIGEI